jgi:hypothetical protein
VHLSNLHVNLSDEQCATLIFNICSFHQICAMRRDHIDLNVRILNGPLVAPSICAGLLKEVTTAAGEKNIFFNVIVHVTSMHRKGY